MTANNNDKNSPLRPRKIFYVILLLLPFILLGLTEVSLRVAGYGHSYPLFIEAEGLSGYLQPNPNLIKRYFHKPELAPDVSPDTVLFKQQKNQDSFRIVIQGGSTAAGFPYGRFGSLTGMLQQRVKRLYPDKNIEVISTAMASVNSYTLRDTVDEIIQIQPDLVLIYAGHNEYLGVMGVGSVYASKGGHLANLLFLALKEVRIFQLIQQLYYTIFDTQGEEFENQGAGQSHSLMAKVAKEKNIAINSPLYQAGINQFEDNLRSILSAYQKANINVLVSSLVANEVDHPPFASDKNADVSLLQQAFKSGQFKQATLLGKTAINRYPNSAEAYYLLAKSLLSEGQVELAKEYFIRANDLDLLRFRAPSEFNQIIRQLSHQYQATLVDAQKFIRQNTESGLIDNQVMFEHLHPNKQGYFLLTEAFIQTIDQLQFLGPAVMVTHQQAWQDIPLTEIDELYAQFKIDNLTSDYPFTSTPQKVAPIKNQNFESAMTLKRIKNEPWLAIQQEILNYYNDQKKSVKAAKVAGIIFDALVNNAQIADVARRLYMDMQDIPMAYYYAKKAVSLKPEHVPYKLNFAQILYNLKRDNEAIVELEAVLKLQPNHPKATFYLEQLNANKPSQNTPK
jgi:tetratricopeptide (TPR) repeat protein